MGWGWWVGGASAIMSGSQGLALGGKGMEDDARAGLGGEFAKDRELRLLARTALVVVCGDITSCLTGVVEHQHPVGSSIFASQSLSPTPRGAGAGDFYDRALGPSRAADVAGREAGAAAPPARYRRLLSCMAR